MKESALFALLFVVFAAMGASAKDADAPAARVSAPQIAAAYVTNEAFADENYTDRPIEVTGRLARIVRSKYGDPNESGPQYVAELCGGRGEDAVPHPKVLFFFRAGQRRELARLKPGDIVKIEGRCHGRVIWGAEPGSGKPDYSEVHFRDCGNPAVTHSQVPIEVDRGMMLDSYEHDRTPRRR
jgi:hypothetical protein